MAEFKYEVVKDYGEISNNPSNYQTCVKAIKWGDSDNIKLDIRKWNTTENKMAKGISLSIDEATELVDILEEFLNDSENDFQPIINDEIEE